MTNTKARKTVVNVGVDVGKTSLDICIYEKGLYWREANTEQGIKQQLKRLSHYRVERLTEFGVRSEIEPSQTLSGILA